MSARIAISGLADGELAALVKELTITPKRPFVPRGAFGDLPPETPVFFYRRSRTHIDVPYMAASRLLDHFPNDDAPLQPSAATFTGQLRPAQEEVMREACQHLEDYGTTTLALYTGFGKTVCGAYLACKTGLLTCVVFQRTFLISQWRATFENQTTARVWVVGEPKTPPPGGFDVVACMNTRIHHIPPEVRERIGTLLLDEAHLLCTPSNVDPLLSLRPRFVVVLSATPEREDGMDRMMKKIAGSHIIRRQFDKAFTVRKIETGIAIPTFEGPNGQMDYNRLLNDTAEHPGRNELILQRVLLNRDKKVLILVARISHVKTLQAMVAAAGISVGTFCASAKKYVDADVLVGTTSKMGVGFDQETACPEYDGRRFDLVILACSFKKQDRLAQNVGRGLRAEYPTIEHLVDAVPAYKRHWSPCHKWYKARGATIEIVKL